MIARPSGVNRVRLGGLGILLAAEGYLLWESVQRTFDQHHVLRYEFGAIGVFLAAIALLRVTAIGRRAAARVIVGTGALFQLLVLTRPASDSDDDFRYLWDAKVQLAGIDPYRYAPSSPALAHLRDNYLFPTGASCTHHAFNGGCTRLNLPDEHTIYPPLTQAVFALVRLLSFGGHGQQRPLQIAAALGTVAITALILRARREKSLWPVALWAWCPVTIMEFSNNAHIDWLGVLGAVGALAAYSQRRFGWAGFLLGASVSAKVYPGLVGAGMLRRRPFFIALVATVTVAVGYLPHIAVVGSSVVGYLPTYLRGYGSGAQYRLLTPWLPDGVATAVAALLLVALVAAAIRYGDPDHPERSALWVVGSAVLITTPTLPWYLLLLLALVAINARPEWLGVVIAPTVEYLLVGNGTSLGPTTSWCYLGALAFLLAGFYWRSRGAGALTGAEPVRSAKELHALET